MDIKNLLSDLNQNWDEFRYKHGHMSEAEHFINQLPDEYKPVAFGYMRELSSLQVAADPNRFYRKTFEFAQFLEEVHPHVEKSLKEDIKKSFVQSATSDIYGYKPSGTKLWNYFPNPYGLFSFIEQSYPVASICTNLVRTAIEEDGFFLVAAKGVSERKLYKTYDLLRNLGIEDLRVELSAHLSVYGNAWIHPVKSRLGLERLDLLFPDNLLPRFDKTRDIIVEWEYQRGRQKFIYSRDSLLHLRLPAIDNDQLGCPPLLPGVTRIETSLNAMNLNNTLMYSGGMASHIVSLKYDDKSGVPADAWLNQVQKQFDYLYSGAKFGHRIIVAKDIDNVFPIAKIGELDANWKYGDARTDKIVAMLRGIPSEKVGVPRSEAAQYQPELVENVINAQFDSTVNRHTRKIDRFLNREVMRGLLGITDIKIVPAGRYGALTLNAAKTLQILAEVGYIITVNEGREKILGWEPCHPEDKRGQIVLNNAAIKKYGQTDTLLPEIFAPEHVDPELESEKSFLQYADKISKESTRICVGGRNDGELYKGSKKARSKGT